MSLKDQAYNDPDSVLAQIQKEMDAWYQEHYRPNNKELIAQIGNGAILESARENAGQQYESSLEQNERNMARYGMTRSSFDTAMNEHKTAAGMTNSQLGEVNTARMTQYEADNNLRQTMINQGRGMTGQAVNGLSSASANFAAVNNANAMASAQHQAQQNQLLGQGLGTAAMIAAMMI